MLEKCANIHGIGYLHSYVFSLTIIDVLLRSYGGYRGYSSLANQQLGTFGHDTDALL